MAKSERELSSPRKEGNLQIATREEIDMYDSVGQEEEAVAGWPRPAKSVYATTAHSKHSSRSSTAPATTAWST